jgi:AraC-like DNA-binding protein
MKRINPDTWDARDHEVDLPLFFQIEQFLLRWLVALADILALRGIDHTGHTGIDERVRMVLDLMHSHDLGEPLDFAQLTGKAGMSQNHLVRLFRRDLQTTPTQYWDRLRIEHARHRLLQPEARVKEVSIELGFTYLSHFSKWFKRHTGFPPREISDQAKDFSKSLQFPAGAKLQMPESYK